MNSERLQDTKSAYKAQEHFHMPIMNMLGKIS
jgi:hypothetical protein